MADRENNVPNEKDTKHRIASLSKSLTAYAIMHLHELGKLNVEDTIDKYLPYYPNGNIITIHHLLTNTSGITDNDNIPEYISASKNKVTLKCLWISLFDTNQDLDFIIATQGLYY